MIATIFITTVFVLFVYAIVYGERSLKIKKEFLELMKKDRDFTYSSSLYYGLYRFSLKFNKKEVSND